jgi:hypothetical protein
MSEQTKTKAKDFVPNQLKDGLFWRGCAFGIVFFSVLLFLHPQASAYLANII